MTWSVVLLREGVPVIDACPVLDWTAADILAEVSASLWGGPVSVVQGVVEQRAADAPKDLFGKALIPGHKNGRAT